MPTSLVSHIRINPTPTDHLHNSDRSVQKENDFLSASIRKATTTTERKIADVFPENITSDEDFECKEKEKKRESSRRSSIAGEEEKEKEDEEEVEVFSDSDSSWDWVSNMDTDADADTEKLSIDGDGDVVDRSDVTKPKMALALALTGTRTVTGTVMEAAETKAETVTYLIAQSDDVCDDDLQESVSMTMSTSMCQLSCRGPPPPHPHGPRGDEIQHEKEVTGPEASPRLHTTDHKSRLSSPSMDADTAVAVAEAEAGAMQQRHTSDMLFMSSIIQAQDSSDKKSDISSKSYASPARPIDKMDSIFPTSSPQHNAREVSPHSMISSLPQSVTIKSVIEHTKQRPAGLAVGEKQDKAEFPDACSHLLLPPSRESDPSFIAMSMADSRSRLSSSATALPTTPEAILSDSAGDIQHLNRAILPLPLYGRAFASKQKSVAGSVPTSSSLSHYHITPLLSALLLPTPSAAPPLPAATRLSPLSVTVSTATSYSPSVSPSSDLQASEIGATSVLPSPLTSPSSSVDGLSPRRGAVRSAAAATATVESSKKQEAGYKAPNVLTVDVQKIGEISSPVSSLSESSLPLSPYALFLQRNAAQVATAQQGLSSLSLSLSHPAPAAPVVKNAMLLSYEEEEAEYRAKHGTSWAPLSPIVYFAEPIEVDTRTRMTGNRKNIRYVYVNMMLCFGGIR